MIQEKKIFIFIIILIFLNCSLLLGWEKYSQNKNSREKWSIYFTDPKGDSLDFTITGGDNQKFIWELEGGKKNIASGNLEVSNEREKTTTLKNDYGKMEGKWIVTVKSENGQEKQIYKIFK